MAWTEVNGLDFARTAAILPTGAVEAHGPQPPTSTDRVIAVALAMAMAEDDARRLAEHGVPALVRGEASFGAPAEATTEEGRSTVAELGAILAKAVLGVISLAEGGLARTELPGSIFFSGSSASGVS